jgi:hypothetical protein
MAFTYSDALTTDREKIRLRIGDTQTDAGPRPDKRNFSDAEITFILSEEDSRVNGAIAHAFEILTSEWTAYAISEKEGEVNFDAKSVADEFRKRAERWRKKPGGADEAEGSGGLVTLTREDAYT